MQNKGNFIISLDFELMWGVRDVTTKEKYGKNILGVREVLPKLLTLFKDYKISVTFATVGFLFLETKEEFLEVIPTQKPNYIHKNLSPYKGINKIGTNEKEDPYHYGMCLINKIKKEGHEIATHTFCHYYCLEDGQNNLEFEEDLKYAIKIAKKRNIALKSIVFPRNQINYNYLEICKKHGVLSYRGNESSWLYKPSKTDEQPLFKRFLRLADSYINISGSNIYDYKTIKETIPFNIPSSAFLRPYNNKLSFLDNLKLRRIKKGMTLAAKKNRVFHLWWHPHNFGINQKKNLLFLKKILTHYTVLNKKYGFQSITMSNLSEKLLKEDENSVIMWKR